MDSPALQTSAVPKATPRPRLADLFLPVWKLCRAWLFRVTLFIVACMLGLSLHVRYRAESNLLCIFLAYLPAWLLAVPLLATLLVGILFVCWRSILTATVCAPLLVLWLGGYRFSPQHISPSAGVNSPLTVLTYNRGQGSEKILAGCAAHHHPDIIVLQDAGRRLPKFAPLSHSFQNGEYIVLSRWPLLESQALELSWPMEKTGYWRAGTRSIVDWNGRRIVIYNIHFPTPRDILYWYANRGAFLYGVIGLIPHTSLHARHQEYLTYWSARVELMAQIKVRVQSEIDPVILMGDLNTPPLGQGYYLLCNVLQDAHQAGGSGFGFTFPSNFKSIGRLVAPWIRIDYVFASSQWEILSCVTPLQEVSQHLPLVAVMKLN